MLTETEATKTGTDGGSKNKGMDWRDDAPSRRFIIFESPFLRGRRYGVTPLRRGDHYAAASAG